MRRASSTASGPVQHRPPDCVRATVVALADEAELPAGFRSDVGLHADVRIARTERDLANALAGADVLYAWDYGRMHLIERAWPSAGRLRWIQTSGIGVDGVLTPAVVASDVVVTNTRGVLEAPLAEYVLAMLLHFVKDIGATTALQARREWRHRETETLRDRRALVVGAGGIGREIARLLAAVGMDVTVVARSARSDPQLGRVRGLEQLDTLLSGAEFLVLAVPLTAATRGLFGRERLARLPRGVRVVNVARGPVIDDDALADAVRRGHVGAAVLDVFAAEPLPPDHVFWELDRVIVSPHMAGDVHGWREACVERFVANLRRWVNREPLENVIDKAAGA